MATRRTLAALALTAGIVYFRIDPEQRARFNAVAGNGISASPNRRGSNPSTTAGPALPVALKDALAVYYYPGTWDWQHDLKQSLVHKAVERSLNDVGAGALIEAGHGRAGLLRRVGEHDRRLPPQVKIDHGRGGLITHPEGDRTGAVDRQRIRVVYACKGGPAGGVMPPPSTGSCRHQIVD